MSGQVEAGAAGPPAAARPRREHASGGGSRHARLISALQPTLGQVHASRPCLQHTHTRMQGTAAPWRTRLAGPVVHGHRLARRHRRRRLQHQRRLAAAAKQAAALLERPGAGRAAPVLRLRGRAGKEDIRGC